MMRAHLAAFDHGKLDAFPVIPPPGALWRSLKFWIWTGFAIVLLAAIPDLIVDYWFFASLGKTGIFWTNFNAQLALFVITLIAFALSDYLPIRQYAVSPTLRNAAIHLGSWSGLFAGWVVSQHWMTLLLWQHRQPFNQADPVFGYDIGFYVFTLPALAALLSLLAAAGFDMAFAFLLGRYDQLRANGHFNFTVAIEISRGDTHIIKFGKIFDHHEPFPVAIAIPYELFFVGQQDIRLAVAIHIT